MCLYEKIRHIEVCHVWGTCALYASFKDLDRILKTLVHVVCVGCVKMESLR